MMSKITHPRYGAPLGGAPVIIDGVIFRPYRAGIAQTVRCSDDFRITINQVERGLGGFAARGKSHFTVTVDGAYLVGADGVRAKRYQTRENAMLAGVRALKKGTR